MATPDLEFGPAYDAEDRMMTSLHTRTQTIILDALNAESRLQPVPRKRERRGEKFLYINVDLACLSFSIILLQSLFSVISVSFFLVFSL